MTTTTSEDRAAAAVPVAAALVVAVHDRDPDASHEILSAATIEDLQALAVVLAAMVPPDWGIATLLDGHRHPCHEYKPAERWKDEELADAHREWVRIRAKNGRPEPWVAVGETEYQHRRRARDAYLADMNARALALRAEGSSDTAVAS